MSPSTVEVTSVSSTPRAAAMLASPAVRQPASAWSRYSTGSGLGPIPTSTFGWSTSRVVACSWVRSSPTPKKPWIVLWLWVPDIQRFDARNLNWAAAGAAFTASRVANRVVVSTPLRTPLVL